jgi:hypothetical protein
MVRPAVSKNGEPFENFAIQYYPSNHNIASLWCDDWFEGRKICEKTEESQSNIGKLGMKINLASSMYLKPNEANGAENRAFFQRFSGVKHVASPDLVDGFVLNP